MKRKVGEIENKIISEFYKRKKTSNYKDVLETYRIAPFG